MGNLINYKIPSVVIKTSVDVNTYFIVHGLLSFQYFIEKNFVDYTINNAALQTLLSGIPSDNGYQSEQIICYKTGQIINSLHCVEIIFTE